ncbi:hypothetical protein H2200_005629 [Cladophialophora chaetospira]|uniref:Uncharacterized protein n=1 Tax=Cladophialophora chaetospira TaxID=386627 RepID=A0AA38XCK1_9EURO|nr:hypothetical protein H2200_005629 [Cladophialophora chaetospira]
MIRFTPTSISLSERDIDFHLQQAKLIYGLRRQGFKKEDIDRYLKNDRGVPDGATCQDTQDPNSSAPSAVDLDRNRPCSSSTSDEPVGSSSTSSTGVLTDPFPDISPDLRDACAEEPVGVRLSAHQAQDAQDDDGESPISMPPSMHVNQHAPRKSSLLRFAQAASPERCPPGPEAEFMVTPRARTYKRRSSTYPYHSSEQDSITETYTQSLVANSANRMPSDDDSLIEELESLSLALPPPYSTGARTPSASASDTQFASPPSGHGSEDSSTLTFIRPSLGRRRSSSLFGRAYSTADIPSSPPLPRTPARQHPRQSQSASASPQLPTTPTPIRDAVAFPRTEPHHYRNQLDGNSFSVYNDSLPAVSQPQTPADLSRQPLITEHDAAYTAPPGMIRSARSNRHAWERESGEQSPTARAITLRERRNRELARSARAEGVRLDRLRMRDEAMFTRRAFQTAIAANGGALAEAMPPVTNDMWREDLDADRVGEENFEVDPGVNGRRIMRTVSGNARFEWEGPFDR